MAAEFHIRFAKSEEYFNKKAELIGSLRKSISYAGEPHENTVWLKESSEVDGWGYDARVFFENNEILLEISRASKLVHNDLRNFVAFMRATIVFEVVDDDGELVDFWG